MRIGNEIVTASALGKRRRMFRIFGDKGKCIVVPLDDNLISKYNEGLKNLHDKIKDIQQAKPNGVLCYLGTASIIDKYEVPIILNLTASTEYKTHTKKILVSTIEQAIAIDAAAVAVHINVSSSYESIMLENLGAVSEVCQKYTISFPVPNPDFVLYEWLRDLEECKGWKSKRIEAEQVYQKKSSLHIYLERAFRILGIEY